uniref:KIB1-4 beta-propeller domain-containing protein n=1 Tax=Oryza punctata TaxID=4537 RepID=A0A0E0M0U4_ORYPU
MRIGTKESEGSTSLDPKLAPVLWFHNYDQYVEESDDEGGDGSGDDEDVSDEDEFGETSGEDESTEETDDDGISDDDDNNDDDEEEEEEEESNELIYLLSEHGRLTVYDPCKHVEGFKILDEAMKFGFEHHDSYLVESDQDELMAALFGRRGTPVHVIVLNEKEWEKVESLQGRTLFTGTLTCMVKKTKFKWMQNRVFLPMFYKWPETVHVNLISHDGELAFLPKSSSSNAKYSTMGDHNNGTCCKKCADVWSYKLG